MTFFLGEKTDMVRRGPNVALPTNSEAIGGAIRNEWQDVNILLQRERQVIGERGTVASDAAAALGPEGMSDFIADFNQRAEAAGLTERKLTPDMTPQEILDAVGPNGAERFLEMAREKAEQDPAALGSVDLSEEGIEARVTEKRKAEAAADAALIALSPNPIRNQLLGGLTAGLMDPVNIAAVPFGLGAGSMLRVLAREAMIGAGVEAVQFPTRSRVAEEIGKEAPDFLGSVAMGALTGGILGGAAEGLPRVVRALMAAREARKIKRSPDVSATTQEEGVQAAERAIAEGRPVDQAVAKVVLAEPTAARKPLILDESMAVTPEPTALAPDPVTEMPLAPVPGIQSTTDQVIATAKSGLIKAGKPKKEVLGWIKRQGVDPEGWLGTELKARGLTHKSYPGLFKKGGLKDIDNIVADEVDPAVSWKIERAADGTYLDRDSIMRALDEDLGAAKAPKAYERDYDPRKAYADPDPEERGFLVSDLEARKFAEPETWRETLDADIDTYIDGKGVTLPPRERAEIKEIAATRGGDIDDLLHSATLRDIDEGEQAHIRAQRGEAYGRPASEVPWGDETGMGDVPGSPGGSLAGEPQAAAGDATPAGARNLEPPGIERTDIGDQYVIPGSREAPVVDKQRQQAEIEARKIQSKMRRLNQARVEDDVDGLFAAKTVDLFDDLNSPEAQSFMDANIQAMRDMLEEGDFPVAAVADDGRALKSLSDILDEIDDDATLMREFDLCRFGGGTAE